MFIDLLWMEARPLVKDSVFQSPSYERFIYICTTQKRYRCISESSLSVYYVLPFFFTFFVSFFHFTNDNNIMAILLLVDDRRYITIVDQYIEAFLGMVTCT